MPTSPLQKVSIILTSWNGIDDARRCLEALSRQTYKNHEVIFVDDGSEDGTATMVAKSFPDVHLIALPEHKGFAITNNTAVREATGELLFIVNTDTEFDQDLLQVLVDAANQYSGFDIFSCQMISIYNRTMVDCKGMQLHCSLRASMLDIGRPVDPFEKPNEIFGATGGAMLLRRKVIEKIGLFDESFYFNNEDVDFSLRAYGAGYRTLYLPEAKVFHRRSPNETKAPDRILYLIQRNLVLAAYKNFPISTWLTHGPLHAAYNAYQILKWGKKGKAGLLLRAKLDALLMMPHLTRTPMSRKKFSKALGIKS